MPSFSLNSFLNSLYSKSIIEVIYFSKTFNIEYFSFYILKLSLLYKDLSFKVILLIIFLSIIKRCYYISFRLEILE